jgi:hypothetical protein
MGVSWTGHLAQYTQEEEEEEEGFGFVASVIMSL